MRVTASVSRVDGRYVARCQEVDREGEGATQEEALAALREALEEYFREAPAVAPPSHPDLSPIEIVVTEVPAD